MTTRVPDYEFKGNMIVNDAIEMLLSGDSDTGVFHGNPVGLFGWISSTTCMDLLEDNEYWADYRNNTNKYSEMRDYVIKDEKLHCYKAAIYIHKDPIYKWYSLRHANMCFKELSTILPDDPLSDDLKNSLAYIFKMAYDTNNNTDALRFYRFLWITTNNKQLADSLIEELKIMVAGTPSKYGVDAFCKSIDNILNNYLSVNIGLDPKFFSVKIELNENN